MTDYGSFIYVQNPLKSSVAEPQLSYPSDVKGSLKGKIGPYKAHIGPYWQYVGL